MNNTYDKRELLPKAIPSSLHPSRTICSRAMSAIYGDTPTECSQGLIRISVAA